MATGPSPCKRHPDTGKPCTIKFGPANCQKCLHRIRWEKRTQPVSDHPLDLDTMCWWPGCAYHARKYRRGLCEYHYSRTRRARTMTLHLSQDLPDDEWYGLLHLLARMCSEDPKLTFKQAVGILVLAGAQAVKGER